MHPQLFTFQVPDFLSNLFNSQEITVYTYGVCIVLGTVIASLYTKWRAKKDLTIIELSNSFFYIIFIAGFIGGKLFYYLEKPIYYIKNLHLLLDNFSGGFVFYGSFITIIPFVIWYLKKYRMPILPMLDILAITTLIVHSIGRLGCFFGGCCYGKPTNAFTGMIFPKTNGVHVHPSQLYEITALLLIMGILFYYKKKQQFSGQLFLLYISFYAISRAILELFRGDKRGYIINQYLSHSQLVALLMLIGASFFYLKLKTKNKLTFK